MKRNNIIQLIEKIKTDQKVIPAFIDNKTEDGKFYWSEIIKKCIQQIDKIVVGQFLPVEFMENVKEYIIERLELINSPEYLIVISTHIVLKVEQYKQLAEELEQYEIAGNLNHLLNILEG